MIPALTMYDQSTQNELAKRDVMTAPVLTFPCILAAENIVLPPGAAQQSRMLSPG